MTLEILKKRWIPYPIEFYPNCSRDWVFSYQLTRKAISEKKASMRIALREVVDGETWKTYYSLI